MFHILHNFLPVSLMVNPHSRSHRKEKPMKHNKDLTVDAMSGKLTFSFFWLRPIHLTDFVISVESIFCLYHAFCFLFGFIGLELVYPKYYSVNNTHV